VLASPARPGVRGARPRRSDGHELPEFGRLAEGDSNLDAERGGMTAT
jgi:hypothetical protein